MAVSPQQVHLLVVGCVSIVAMVIGGYVMVWLRKRTHPAEQSEGDSGVLTMEQIDALQARGEITAQEHAVLRNQVLVPLLQEAGEEELGEKNSQLEDGPATMGHSLGADGLPEGTQSTENDTTSEEKGQG